MSTLARLDEIAPGHWDRIQAEALTFPLDDTARAAIRQLPQPQEDEADAA